MNKACPVPQDKMVHLVPWVLLVFLVSKVTQDLKVKRVTQA